MADKDERNWLDEAFDDKKNAEEMERLNRSQRNGCIIWAIVLVIAIIVFVLALGAFSFMAIGS